MGKLPGTVGCSNGHVFQLVATGLNLELRWNRETIVADFTGGELRSLRSLGEYCFKLLLECRNQKR